MKNKGITLISLVVTIVILIILASTAIYLSLSNNGIFKKTIEAKEKHLNAQDIESKDIKGFVNVIDSSIVSSRNEETHIREPIVIPELTTALLIRNGGEGIFKINVKGYNNLSIDSRIYDIVCGTTYWQITGKKDDGSSEEILNSSEQSFEKEEFDISEYSELSINITCTEHGSTTAFAYYTYNNIKIY